MIDAAIDTAMQHISASDGPDDVDVSAWRQYLITLHDVRHTFLDQMFYVVSYEIKHEVLSNLTALFCTTSVFRKHLAQRDTYRRQLKKVDFTFGFFDEYQKEGWELTSAAMTPFDAAVLVGDHRQNKFNRKTPTIGKNPECQDLLGSQKLQGRSHDTVNRHTAAWWALRNSKQQKLSTGLVFRYSQIVVDLLRFLNDEDYNNMTSVCDHSTNVVPVLLARDDGSAVADVAPFNEISRSPAEFCLILLLLAVEILVSVVMSDVHPNRPPTSIGLAFYYRSQLTRLEQFLYYHLHKAVLKLHEIAGIPFPSGGAERYYYTALRDEKRLQLLGPVEQGGLTFHVYFVLPWQRAPNDETWKATLNDPDIREVALTRVSHRLYLCIPDLRLTEQTQDCTQAQRDENTWQCLLNAIPNMFWTTHLHIPQAKQCILSRTLEEPPPHFSSDMYWEGLIQASALQNLSTLLADRWSVLVNSAFEAYAGMYWGPPWQQSAKAGADLPRYADVFRGRTSQRFFNKALDSLMARPRDLRGHVLPDFRAMYEKPVPIRFLTDDVHVLDGVAVHIETPSCATVLVPVLVLAQETGNEIYSESVQQIARHIQLTTANMLWYINSSSEVTLDIRRHKAEEEDIDGMRHVEKECWSDRPAFCVHLDRHTPEEIFEALHAYHACGLVEDHAQIRMILCRCKQHSLAASVIAACNDLFNCSYTAKQKQRLEIT